MTHGRSADVVIEVPFHDLDPLGVVWHGHYAKYLEIARCALLQSFDYNYDRMLESGYSWPVIDLHTRFVKPSVFAQRLRVRATLEEWEYRLRIAYLVADERTGERICTARTDQVAVDRRTGAMCLRSPAVLFERLGIAP